MGVLILLDHWVVMSILFQLVCFSSSGSDHFNICEIISKFYQRCFFLRPKLPLFFPALPPFFFKDSDFLIKYPSYRWEVSPFFSVNVHIQWFPMKILTELQVYHSLFSYLPRWFQCKLSVLIVSFHRFKCLSGVLKVSQRIHVSILNPF